MHVNSCHGLSCLYLLLFIMSPPISESSLKMMLIVIGTCLALLVVLLVSVNKNKLQSSPPIPPLPITPPPNTAAHFQVPNKGFVGYISLPIPPISEWRIPPLFRQSRDRRYWGGRLYKYEVGVCNNLRSYDLLKT